MAGFEVSTEADPVHHAPFRTTQVSYDPKDFNAPVGAGLVSSLGYGIGRFPVKTTNAMNHTEYAAYDPLKGVLLQKTGPNGIHTCFTYDDLGRQITATGHCGSNGPLTTTTTYALTGPPSYTGAGLFSQVLPAAGLPVTSATVTISRPPNGATTWSFADDQGKSCAKQSHAFDGGFVGTRVTYNALGMVAQVSKPFHLAKFTDTPTMSLTTTNYDPILLNRVYSISEDLGTIDGSGSSKSAVSTMSYDGSKLVTTRVVNGQLETETEIKIGRAHV